MQQKSIKCWCVCVRMFVFIFEFWKKKKVRTKWIPICDAYNNIFINPFISSLRYTFFFYILFICLAVSNRVQLSRLRAVKIARDRNAFILSTVCQFRVIQISCVQHNYDALPSGCGNTENFRCVFVRATVAVVAISVRHFGVKLE